jgi:hypothetical protein
MAPILGIWASAQTANSSSYHSIATTTVGAGGASSITFSSIPQGYTHLQIRGIARTASAATYGTSDTLAIYVNSDGSTTYANHDVYGADGTSGTSTFAGANNAVFSSIQGWMATSSSNTSVFSTHIIDILDYTSTNKNKTIRTLGGYEDNRNGFGYGQIRLGSSLYKTNTNAITSLTLFVYSSANFAQYTSFGLYGIKG